MTITHWLRAALAPRPAARKRPAIRRLAVEGLEDRSTPSTGGLLDPTFGTGGTVLNSLSNHDDVAQAVVAQPDGKTVIAGSTQASGSKSVSSFLVARYNSDGTPDVSFGSGGHATTAIDVGGSGANAVSLQTEPDGTTRILAAGGATTRKGALELALARYNPDGTLDATFGSRGKVETDLGGVSALAMAVDGSGRIVVAGYGTNSSGTATTVLARYTRNGAADTTFGSSGKVVVNIPIRNAAHGVSIAPQTDGGVLIAGTILDPANNAPEFVVARFNANGAADAGFGTGGVVTTHPGFTDGFGGLAVQGDGKFVIGGSEFSSNVASALYLLRYNPDGTPDAGFGTSGLAAIPTPIPGHPVNTRGSGVSVGADGMIVAAGLYHADSTGPAILAAVRVNPDGSVDSGYGTGGWATAEPGYTATTVNAMAVQPDGRVVLAGYARPTVNAYPTDVFMARFLASAPQVGAFSATPNPVAAGSPFTLTAGGIADGNTGASITEVDFYVLNPDGTQRLLGAGTPSADGTWTLTIDTTGWAAGSYTLLAQATDNYGAAGDPLSLSLQAV